MIRLSKWAVIAGALAAVMAFLDNIGKFVGMLTQLPIPDWAAVLALYNLEFAAAIALTALALTINWEAVGERYAAYRKLWAGPEFRLGPFSTTPEEFVLCLSLLLFLAAFSNFEVQKTRNLYTAYGFGFIVRAGCSGELEAARDRSATLANNRFWNKYSDIFQNLRERYALLVEMTPLRLKMFGRYKDDLPSELLQSDSYEIRVLFPTDLDVGGRARETKQPLAKSWLENAVPCKAKGLEK